MKKKLLVMLLLLLIPILSYAETCDESKIKIESINLSSLEGSAKEKSNPVIDGRNINLNLNMSKVGDSALYTVKVKNESDEEYLLDESSLTKESDYIVYSLETDDDKIIKPKEEKSVSLRVKYHKEVEESDFKDGVYQDNKKLVVNLSNGNNVTSNNPKTGNSFLMYISILIMIIGSTIVIKVKKTKYIVLLLTLTIPFTVNAICNYNIEFISNIEIKEPIPDPIAFGTDSWETIVKAVKEKNVNVYSVGDTRTIDLGNLGIHTLRIANKSTQNECLSSTFSQTACGFVIEFADIVSNSNWISSNYSNGGWRDSAARTYVNNTIYNTFPEVLKDAIIDTRVVSSHNSNETENYITTDKLYLLAMREIYGNYIVSYGFYSNDSAYESSRQLDYYKSINLSEENYSKAEKKFNGTAEYWYTRTARNNSSASVYVVLTGGNYNGTTGEYGMSPAFRLG